MIAELAPPNTKLKWSNARANFGMCSYQRGNPTYFIITISKPLAELNDDETVKQVVLHEIAHALTPGHGHDTTWKQKCLELGGNGERCYNQLAVKTPKHKNLDLNNLKTILYVQNAVNLLLSGVCEIK